MKKNLSFLIVLLLTQSVFSQDSLVFKQFNLDSVSGIIAVCPYYDKKKVYKDYTFYIDKKEDLKKISQTLFHGEKIKFDTLDDNLEIYLIGKNKEVLPVQIGASPKYGYLTIESDDYSFISAQFRTLAKTYPLNYTAKIMKFMKDDDFNDFLKKYLSDPNFLCFKDITEELEGICPVTVKITSKEKPASEGWNIIENDLKKLGAKKGEDYVMSYTPNSTNSDIYHYEIRFSKKLYDKLINSAYTKGKWTMNPKEIITHWKK